jgi:hypothetical protein
VFVCEENNTHFQTYSFTHIYSVPPSLFSLILSLPVAYTLSPGLRALSLPFARVRPRSQAQGKSDANRERGSSVQANG